MNDVAVSIQKRANSAGVSIAKLCRDAGVSRAWFDLLKQRTPKTIDAYLKIDNYLSDIENRVE